jgi:hypothetical protein
MNVLTIDEGIQKQKNEAFLKLVRKNPTLPIVPMVDSDIVAEDCGYWMGAFGSASVGEYACYDDRFFDDREEFKERYYDNNDDELCEMFNFVPCMTFSKGYTKEQVEENKVNEKKLDEHLDKIADEYFKKAIIVYIVLPD